MRHIRFYSSCYCVVFFFIYENNLVYLFINLVKLYCFAMCFCVFDASIILVVLAVLTICLTSSADWLYILIELLSNKIHMYRCDNVDVV